MVDRIPRKASRLRGSPRTRLIEKMPRECRDHGHVDEERYQQRDRAIDGVVLDRLRHDQQGLIALQYTTRSARAGTESHHVTGAGTTTSKPRQSSGILEQTHG